VVSQRAADHDRLGVDPAPRSVRVGLVLVIGGEGLRPSDQVDERPQVNPGDLDDVVALLPKRQRNGPAAIGCDVQDDDPQAEVLNLGDDLGDVLVSTGDEGVGDRAALGQGHQIPAELALDPLAPPRLRIDKAQLQAGHLG
jgi:hypothetical protein